MYKEYVELGKKYSIQDLIINKQNYSRSKLCGIYKISNLTNHKIYIGSSKEIRKRWVAHIKDFLDNTHHNGKLQNHFNKYGIENFLFEIVEFCEEKDLIEIETNYILKLNTLKEGFNLVLPAKQPINDKRVRCIETGIIYKSINEAAEKTGVRSDSISAVCRGVQGKAGGFMWELVDSISKKYENKPIRTRKVYCFNNDTTYNSVKEASLKLNLHDSTIIDVCKGKKKHVGNYTFKYVDGKGVTKHSFRIKCINNGVEFKSIEEASRVMGIGRKVIDNQLQGIKSKNTDLIFEKLTD